MPSLDRCWKLLPVPQAWSIPARRVFLLLLPISLPLWLLALAGLAVAVIARAMARPVAAFWNAPPKRVRTRSSSYYEYGRPNASSNKIYLVTDRSARDAA